MVDIPEALQHKLGPLEAWQWGALAGGAILVYRVVATKGHQTTSVGTVTLTPNNQPDLSGSGTDTVGSVLSGFAATGLFPDEFSITLPNGTVVTFKGGRIVSTTPPGGTTTPPASDPPPPLGAIGSPVLSLPMPRPGGPLIPGTTPNPLPGARAGVSPFPIPVWTGLSPNPLPVRPGGPASGGTPTPLPGRSGGVAIPGVRPNPLPGATGPATVVIPVRPGGGTTGGTPPAGLPGRH